MVCGLGRIYTKRDSGSSFISLRNEEGAKTLWILLNWVDFLSHLPQLYGLSPVWVLLCIFKLLNLADLQLALRLITDSTFRFQLDVCTHPSTSRQQPAGPTRPRHGYPWGPWPPAWPRPSRRPTVPACPQPQRPQRGFGGLGWGRPHAAPGLRTRPPPTLHSAECGSSSGRQASKGKTMIGERTQPRSG